MEIVRGTLTERLENATAWPADLANLPKPSFITHSVKNGGWYEYVMEKNIIAPKLEKGLSLSLDGSFAHFNMNAITLVFSLEEIVSKYRHKPVLYTLVYDGFKKIELDDCYLMDIGLFHETEIKAQQEIPLNEALYATIDYEGKAEEEKIRKDLIERGIKIKKSIPKTTLYKIIKEKERLYNGGRSWEEEDLRNATLGTGRLVSYFNFLSVYNRFISNLFNVNYKGALEQSIDYLAQQRPLFQRITPLCVVALNYFKKELKDSKKTHGRK